MNTEQTQALKSLGAAKHILLADDNQSVREALTRVLVLAGYEVTTAASGNEASAKFSEGRFDVVLLDWMMPDGNGQDAFQRINEVNPALPVIVITARPDMVTPSIAARLASIFAKPVDLPRLLQTIQSSLCGPTGTPSTPITTVPITPEKSEPGSLPQISVNALVDTRKTILLDGNGEVSSDRIAGKYAHRKVLPNTRRQSSNTVFGRVVSCCFNFIV
jgi:CheY-like chemotaxis protein